METIDTGIIIKEYNYSNYDKIVYLITKNNGIIKLFAPGIRKITSKNRSAIILFNEINLSFFKAKFKNKHSKLKRAKIINNNWIKIIQKINNLKYLNKFFILLNNFTYTKKKSHKVYNLTTEFLSLAINLENIKKIFPFFLYKFIQIMNYKINLDNCSICYSKRYIFTFSIINGGILCKKCAEQNNIDKININYLKMIILYLSANNINDINLAIYNDEIIKNMELTIVVFFLENLGIKI